MVSSYVKAVIIIALLAFLVTFGIINSAPVEVKYLNIFKAYVPLYAVVYSCLILGIVIGMLIGFSHRFKLHRELRAAHKQNKDMATELEVLRAKTAAPHMVAAPGTASLDASYLPPADDATGFEKDHKNHDRDYNNY